MVVEWLVLLKLFRKISMEWSIFPYVLLHPLVDIRKMTEGEHSALVACRITVSRSPSAQSTFRLSAAFINVCSMQMSH